MNQHQSIVSDPGATFSATDDLSDLNRPSKLSAPIPITGANGDLIYATHVGVSYFDPRHKVYFVPQSAVKLVSLGALAVLGYMVHTDKDRSIVITAASGSILCSCPIQPNNTWIFPSFLMTGKNSPTTAVATAVPTGISGTSDATVLPFLVPHDQRHFTKDIFTTSWIIPMTVLSSSLLTKASSLIIPTLPVKTLI